MCPDTVAVIVVFTGVSDSLFPWCWRSGWRLFAYELISVDVDFDSLICRDVQWNDCTECEIRSYWSECQLLALFYPYILEIIMCVCMYLCMYICKYVKWSLSPWCWGRGTAEISTNWKTLKVTLWVKTKTFFSVSSIKLPEQKQQQWLRVLTHPLLITININFNTNWCQCVLACLP